MVEGKEREREKGEKGGREGGGVNYRVREEES